MSVPAPILSFPLPQPSPSQGEGTATEPALFWIVESGGGIYAAERAGASPSPP